METVLTALELTVGSAGHNIEVVFDVYGEDLFDLHAKGTGAEPAWGPAPSLL